MRTLWQIVQDAANGSLSSRAAYRLLRSMIRAAKQR